jgi:hypothetical protein
MAKIGEENSIKKVGGKEEIRQFLAKLGFIPGSHVTIVTKNSGNVIVCEGYIPRMYPETDSLPKQHTSPFKARYVDCKYQRISCSRQP